jgi:PAS domain S-box-containing protein
VPLLLAAIIAARAAGLRESYENDALRLVLSFTFYTLVSLGTLFLIGRSFLASGSPGLLLLECGVVLWSLAGTVGDIVDHGDANINVTIFNTGILLAGLCHLAGAILSLWPQRSLRAKSLWLGAGCALALGSLGLVTWAALSHRLPIFFIPGQGGTTVRYYVLVSATAMFVLSAVVLYAGKRAARSPFTSWYSVAMLLLAVGLFGIMIQLSLWSVVNWLGRTAQWLGGMYLLLAAIAAMRESNQPLLPLGEKSRPPLYRDAVAVVIVLAATALRLVFLSALSTHSPFLVFYPAVIFAALYGGRRAGLLATVLSAILADYFWIKPPGQFPVAHPADWIALAVFVASCTMISFVCDAMRRAQIRAVAAEEQAKHAIEREETAAALRTSEARFRNLFNNMTEGFALHEIVCDEKGRPCDYRFLDINPAFERLTGLAREDVVGKLVSTVLPENDPYWVETYGAVAVTGRPVHFENYSSPLKRHYEVYAYRPAPGQFAVMFMDITERKRAEDTLRENEQQFRTMAESIPQLAWMAQPDGHIFWYNRRWYEYTGTTLEQMEGWGWQAVHDPDAIPRVLKRWKAAIAEGKPWEDTFPLRRHDGAMRPHLSRAIPLCDQEGRVVRWFGTNTDITEQIETEEALQRAKAAAEAANVAKGQFLANMSHELRTPMNAILGMIDVALPKANDPTVQDCLQTARGSADLLLTLLNDLLDSAKIESGKLELESTPFSLRRMLDQITRVLAVRASEKGLCFYCRMPDETPDAVIGDRTRLQQVLLNLAGNAIKFTELGNVEIGLHAVSQDGEACLEFTVRDTGIGIPPSGLERLFQPFAQADASMARRFGGTGLGLSICKSLVEMMGGRIWVESELGKGSTFYFTVRLPLTKELPSDFEAPVTVPAVACAQLRILLVEDNPANQKLATYILQDRGHLVEMAGDGQEAVVLTEQNRYDVILMDVQMPEMNGLEATAAIRKREGAGRRVPIIAMTAHAMKSDREQCLAAGMDAYLSKPINGHEMIALVETLAAGSPSVAAAAASPPTAPLQAEEPPAAALSGSELALNRRRAEQRLNMGTARPALTVSEIDARALVHELQVHQIELEMQNEELLRAQAAAEEASARYCDLFDFAPIAYFVWDHQGRILEVNLAGVVLLGLDREAVIHKRFGQFVAVDHRARFAEFCARVLATDNKQSCVITVLKDGQAIDTLVEGIATQGRQGEERLCRAAIIDISQRTRAEELAAANRANVQFAAEVSDEIRSPRTAVVPAATVFDPELALSRCFESTDMVREMIQCFFEETDSVFPQMRAALEKGDLVEVGRLGHRLKGTVVYLGAQSAEEAARGAERFCKSSGGTPSEAEDAINALMNECLVLKAALTQHPLAAEPKQSD